MPSHSTVRGRAFLRTLHNTTSLSDPAAPAPVDAAHAVFLHHHPMKKRARPAACFSFLVFFVALVVFAFFVPFVNRFTRDLITAPSSVPILSPADPTRRTAKHVPAVARQVVAPPPAVSPQVIAPPPADADQVVAPPAANTRVATQAEDAAASDTSDEKQASEPVSGRAASSPSPRNETVAPANFTTPASPKLSRATAAPFSAAAAAAAQSPAQLAELSAHLGLTNRSMLNYFHMHKTGGVTTKTLLIALLRHPENLAKRKANGEPLRYLDTCYTTPPAERATRAGAARKRGVLRDTEWRCDFRQIRRLAPATRADTDLLMGHQYWVNGCDALFGSARDVRYLSIFRHPLPRKLSFYYHFFVRNSGRREDAVSARELVAFVLGSRALRADPRSRDAGPNYYASRFLSDGIAGFSENAYTADPKAAIAASARRLDSRYVMVGLQTQPAASQCMLRKLVHVFARAHGVHGLAGSERLTQGESRLNSGSYAWTARRVWDVMNETQRAAFKRVERVDLAIYERVRRRFVDDVKRFRCEGAVDAKEWEEDVFE